LDENQTTTYIESDNELENSEQDDVSNNEGIEITSTPTNTTAECRPSFQNSNHDQKTKSFKYKYN